MRYFSYPEKYLFFVLLCYQGSRLRGRLNYFGWPDKGRVSTPREGQGRGPGVKVLERPLRPCAKVGCPVLVRPPERYCIKHAGEVNAREAERQRFYDEQNRDPKLVEFYHSQAWKALRQQVLARDAYLCQPCLREKRITRADTVHHIVPVREDWSRRLDPTNLEAVCRECHSKLHSS